MPVQFWITDLKLKIKEEFELMIQIWTDERQLKFIKLGPTHPELHAML